MALAGTGTFLATVPLFKTFTRAELLELGGLLNPQIIVAGTKIIREGDPGNVFYIVRSGRVGVYRQTEGGDQQKVAVLGPGDPLGLLALIDGERRTATCVAEDRVLVLQGSKSMFDRLFSRGSIIAYKLLDALSTDLCRRLEDAHQVHYRFYAEPEASACKLRQLAKRVAKRAEKECEAIRVVHFEADRNRLRGPSLAKACR